MSEFTDYLEDALLDHAFSEGVRDYTASTGLYVALTTSTISDDGTGMTEPTLGGYARQPVTFGAAASGTTSNSLQVDFTASGAAYDATITGMAIMFQITGGEMLCYDMDMTDTTINDGDTLRFAVGDIDISLD